jgi:hypothetical protein
MQNKEKNHEREKEKDGWFGQRLWADFIVSNDETDWQVVRNEAAMEAAAQAQPTRGKVEVAPSVTLEAVPVPISTHTPPVQRVPVPAAAMAPSVAVAAAAPIPAVEESKWAKELRVLAEMGFTDPARVIPLLEGHFSTASSHSEGLQNVVAELLSDSAVWH